VGNKEITAAQAQKLQKALALRKSQKMKLRTLKL